LPAYLNNPLQRPLLVQKGVCTYLWGSFSQQVGNTNAALQSVAVAANVATIAALILNGPAPVVGGLISIYNSTTASGAFNVDRAVITAVVMNTTTNVATISFGLTAANVANTDSGTVTVEPAEVGEPIVNNTNSIACVIQAPEGDSQFTVPLAVTFPGGLPTALTAQIQRALKDSSNEWTNTSGVVTVVAGAYSPAGAGPVVEVTLERAYLYRVALTGLTGTGSIVAKIGG
jgi:hypothetical protein